MSADQTATLQEIVSRLDALQTSIDELLVEVRGRRSAAPIAVHNGNDVDSVESDADWVGPCRTKNCGHDTPDVIDWLDASGLPDKIVRALWTARYHTIEAVTAAEDTTLLSLMGGIGGWNGLKKIRAWQERAIALAESGDVEVST